MKIFLIASLVLLFADIGCVISPNRAAPNDPLVRPKGIPQGPHLKLLSMAGQIEHGFVKVEGQVENIADERIEDVMAVVTHYDANSNFITSSTGMIEYDPIMPGQVSPYSVTTKHNPQISRFTVDFKTIRGVQLVVLDRTKPDPAPGKTKKK